MQWLACFSKILQITGIGASLNSAHNKYGLKFSVQNEDKPTIENFEQTSDIIYVQNFQR